MLKRYGAGEDAQAAERHLWHIYLTWLAEESAPLWDIVQLQLFVEGLDVCMHLLPRGQAGPP